MRQRVAEVQDIAKLDIHRDKKCGIPEGLFGPGEGPVLIAKQSNIK